MCLVILKLEKNLCLTNMTAGSSTDYSQLPKVPLSTEKCMLATKIN